MLKSLTYYWRIHLAVVLGAMVATAVLTGALLVGDSVRGSLRDLTLERLGAIDHALIAPDWIRSGLSDDLSAAPDLSGVAIVPALLTGGSAVHRDSRRRASGINLLGIGDGFASLYSNGDSLTAPLDAWSKRRAPVVLNRALADDLGAAVGDVLFVTLQTVSAIPRETLFGDAASEAVLDRLTVEVAAIVSDRHAGRFSLKHEQGVPGNAFLRLRDLQTAMRAEERVNLLLAHGPDVPPAALDSALRHVATLDEFGLTLRVAGDYGAVESPSFLLRPAVAAEVDSALAALSVPTLPLLTYLANRMRTGERETPYSTVTALQPPGSEFPVSLPALDGNGLSAIPSDGIVLNTWTADDLQAVPGDTVLLTYYAVGIDERLITQERPFVVSGIAAMRGLGADATLTPDYPGIEDADRIRDWDPPFPMELDRIRPKDEAYWEAYRGTPKAFVALETGQSLWGNRFGELSAIRFGPSPERSLDATAADLRARLLERLRPAMVGLQFRPVKAEGLAASQGATDFSGLFIGFSMFLIGAAALLVGLLFRLGVEQRAGEFGLLLATGYPLSRVRRRFIGEGLLLAGIGILLGSAASVAYAELMITGLRTWWSAATGTGYLTVHVNAASLIGGALGALAVVWIAIWRGLSQLRRIAVPALLRGVSTPPGRGGGGKSRRVALLALVIAIAAAVAAPLAGGSAMPALFFVAGAGLLTSGLAATGMLLRRPGAVGTLTAAQSLEQPGVLLGMAVKNAARKPGRSLLSIALVATATFMIVAVGANHRDFRTLEITRDSGVGGYALMAESDIPIHQSLATAEGRFDLGFSDSDAARFDSATVTAFRMLPGEDASCLNLYRPGRPRVLGVPRSQIERGGFRFAATVEERRNPWTLLMTPAPSAPVVPGFADQNSAMWILHYQLGDTLFMTDDLGRRMGIHLVGFFETSIFQSEILISQDAFTAHFPGRTGSSFFLVDVPETQRAAMREILEATLGDFGLDVTTTTERLAAYHVVQNTYLSVFQALGGLGLLLGTLGLGIVLVRNVLERRGEFATLRAFGYRQAILSRLLIAEHLWLMGWGMVVGAAAAALAVLPHLVRHLDQVPLLSLAVTLAVILLVGLAATLVAVRAAARIPLLPALKAE